MLAKQSGCWFLITYQSYSEPPEKELEKQPRSQVFCPTRQRGCSRSHSHPLGNCVFLGPPPLGIFVALLWRGRGMDIFWNYNEQASGSLFLHALYVQSLFTVKTTSNCNRYSFFLSLFLRFEAIDRRDEVIVSACLNCLLLQGSPQEIG